MHFVLQTSEHLSYEGHTFNIPLADKFQLHFTQSCLQPLKGHAKLQDLFMVGDTGQLGNRLKSRTGNKPKLVIIMIGLQPNIQIV